METPETKYLTFESKATESKDGRTIKHYISTIDLDRYEDVVLPGGMDAKDFLKTRTVLFNHNSDMPIGKNRELTIVNDGVIAHTYFSETPFANDIYTMHKEGILNSWSIGFRTKVQEYDEVREVNTIKEWELFEYSSVSVPANPNAIDLAKSVCKSLEMKSEIQTIETDIKVKELINKNTELLALVEQAKSEKELLSKDIEEIKHLLEEKEKEIAKHTSESLRRERIDTVEKLVRENLAQKHFEIFGRYK